MVENTITSPQPEAFSPEYGRINRRAILAINLVEPDPNDYENPYATRYLNNADPEFLDTSYADKVADGTFKRAQLVKASFRTLTFFVDSLDHPNSVSPVARVAAFSLLRTIRNQNPRFSVFSDSEFTAFFRSHLTPVVGITRDELSERRDKSNERGLRPANGDLPRRVSPEMQRRINRRRLIAQQEAAAAREILYPGYIVSLPAREVPPVEPQSPQPQIASKGNDSAEESFLDHILKPVQIYPFKPNPGREE